MIKKIKKEIADSAIDGKNLLEERNIRLALTRLDDGTALIERHFVLSRELFYTYVKEAIAAAPGQRTVRTIPISQECPRFKVKINIAWPFMPCGGCPHHLDFNPKAGTTLCDFVPLVPTDEEVRRQ